MDFPSHPKLNENVGFLMRKVSGVSFARFSAVTGEHGLHPMHFGVLSVLESDGPIAQNALAASLGVDASTMVARMDVLEQHGLVERHRRAEDRRAYEITLTTKGKRTLTQLRREAGRVYQETYGVLSEPEQRQLAKLLGKLAKGIDEGHQPTAP